MKKFLKVKKDEAEVEATTTKVPRSGVLGKMGLKKKVAVKVAGKKKAPARKKK